MSTRITGGTTYSRKMTGLHHVVSHINNRHGTFRSWVGKSKETAFEKNGRLKDAGDIIQIQIEEEKAHIESCNPLLCGHAHKARCCKLLACMKDAGYHDSYGGSRMLHYRVLCTGLCSDSTALILSDSRAK